MTEDLTLPPAPEAPVPGAILRQTPVSEKPVSQPPSSGAAASAKIPTHWYSVAQLGLSLLAVLALWGMAASTLLAALSQRLLGKAGGAELLPIALIGVSFFFMGVLLLPSAYYALMRLLGRPVVHTNRMWSRLRPTLLIFGLPVLFAAGYWISQNQTLAWLLLPPVHVVTITLPLLWLTYLGVRELPLGSTQRASGVFASGAIIAPAVILFAELFALLGGIVLIVAILASNPAQLEYLIRLADQLKYAAPTPEASLQLLQPILNSPWVIFAVITFAAVIVPLIEEAIKPVGLWLLAGKRLSPAAGFAAGMLSGAGYAVIESLLLTSSGQDWIFLVFARIGTGAVHILTSGLIGWALVLAWNQGSYLRLGAVYLLGVLIHGTWNGMTMIIAFNDITPAHGATGIGFLSTAGQVAPYVLGSIAVLSFAGLLLANRRLARQVNAKETIV